MSAAFKPNYGVYQYPPALVPPPPPPPQTKNVRKPYIIAGIFAFLSALLMVIWCYSYQGGYAWGSLWYMPQQWNWHATLTMFGFSIFFAESIVVFRVNKKNSKRTSKIMHVIFNLGGLLLTTIGLAAMFTTKLTIFNGHFFSIHSWIGILTYILFIGQFACGILTHLIPVLPKSLSSYHRQCGIAIYILAIVSVATGIMMKTVVNSSSYPQLDAQGVVINFMGLSFIMFSMTVLYIITRPEYK